MAKYWAGTEQISGDDLRKLLANYRHDGWTITGGPGCYTVSISGEPDRIYEQV